MSPAPLRTAVVFAARFFRASRVTTGHIVIFFWICLEAILGPDGGRLPRRAGRVRAGHRRSALESFEALDLSRYIFEARSIAPISACPNEQLTKVEDLSEMFDVSEEDDPNALPNGLEERRVSDEHRSLRMNRRADPYYSKGA